MPLSTSRLTRQARRWALRAVVLAGAIAGVGLQTAAAGRFPHASRPAPDREAADTLAHPLEEPTARRP